MSEGKNTIIDRDLVTIEFDPFKERTITTFDYDVVFEHSDFAVTVELNFSHWKSAEFEFIRVSVSTVTVEENVDPDDAFFESLEILADLEKIDPFESSQNSVNQELVQTGYSTYWQYSSSGYVDFSIESARKIASAKKIEVRYSSANDHTDLDDEVEKKIKDAFIVLYHESVENIFSSRVKKIQNAFEEDEKIEKQANAFLIVSGILIVLAIYYYFFR